MKPSELSKLLPQVKMQPGYSADEVDELFTDFIAEVGAIPHGDYLAFLREHRGCAGPVGHRGYIVIWPLDEVISATEDYHVGEFAPGLLLFATDGGNEAYAFDRVRTGWPIVSVPLVGMSREEMVFVASTFSEFVSCLAEDRMPI